MNISVTPKKRTRKLPDDVTITFFDEDAVGVILPYNDALIMTVLIGSCQVKRIMVDSRSSGNILRWKVVEEIGLLEKMILAARTLSRFSMASETTKGEIDLPVEAGGVTKYTKFYVIGGDIQYNAIFGRSWLHDMNVVPSTLHLLLKFPTPDGNRQIRGEDTTRDMFIVEEPAAVESPSKPTLYQLQSPIPALDAYQQAPTDSKNDMRPEEVEDDYGVPRYF
ncbi:uncharacterized protein LOC132628676 [Lycium barbarum]|uniref:uncharacterized protein LOC132628676 n=1 Tax=Lycium barbarum TaxID=112863 RepID=UPI00293E580B|nr:uncharacterized protein LOC132628676 [Lycium barbarum]